MFKYLYLAFALTIFTSSCKEEIEEEEEVPNEEIRVLIEPLYDGEAIDFESTYLTEEGYRIRYTKINIITTQIKNSEERLLASSAVYKMENDHRLLFQGEGDFTEFGAFSGNVGVDPERNHNDPSALPLSDPLNIMNTGDMHWGWDPGYIFLMIEGRADTTMTGEGPFDMVFLYHVGTDDLLRTFNVNDVQWTKKSAHLHETTLAIDMEKVFNSIHTVNIKEERTSHTDPGQEPLSTKIIENFVAAIHAK